MITTARLFRGLLVLLVAFGGGWTQASAWSEPAADDSRPLEESFRRPADAAKPWAYWWWLNANVTRESISRDLAQLKEKGVGGVLLFDVTEYGHHLVPAPPRRVEFLSPEWRRLVKYAMSEANRLGLQMSINLSTCGGALRAPWKTGDDAPKRLLWTSADVVGPKRLTCVVPPDQGRPLWEVAILAVRLGPDGDARRSSAPATESETIRFSNRPEDAKPVVTKPSKPAVATEVIDLADRIDAQGRLTWEVPPGRWQILRFVYTVTEGAESDVDMLDADAVTTHFNRFGRTILDDAGPLAGTTLTHFYSVSWEGAIPTWTSGFDREFEKYRGYRIRPYLPVLAGMTVDSPEVSQRFLRDYSRTLSDCFMNNCYGTLGHLCHEAGLKWHSESGGPWRRNTLLFEHADALAFWGRNDMPQGEFWWPGLPSVGHFHVPPNGRTIGRSNGRHAAMAAHIYGRPLASIEAFTHMKPHWSAYPAAIKPGADAAFCDGINQFIWHTCSASPREFGKPGIVYFAGTHLNPNVTWWEQAGGILTYLARCQTVLRQGKFGADVCCYRSDRNYTTWIRDGRGRKPEFELPQGYAFDLINTEVLLERLSVKDGVLVLPDGMQYRLLLFDPEEEAVPPEAVEKVIELASQGATIVLGPRRPERAPGLKNYPTCDEAVRRLAAKLWGDSGAEKGAEKGDRSNLPERPGRVLRTNWTCPLFPPGRLRSLGKGKVVGGAAFEQAFLGEGVLPDCTTPWEFIHRRKRGQVQFAGTAREGASHKLDLSPFSATDVYFLAGEGRAECTFRVSGKEPELWDPVTGEIRDAVCWRKEHDGRTTVPVSLPENGSIFVVFQRRAQPAHLVSVSGPEQGLEIRGRTDSGAEIRLWQNGQYRLKTSRGQQVQVKATALPQPMPLAGPWQVRFAPGWGAPESVVFDELTAWDKHPDEAIKHFSGTATYRRTFTLDEERAAALVRLQLGEVLHIARVRVNGKDLGVTWTAPWTVDLTGVVRPGENTLEIDVTNLWVNRLIGDAGLPEDQRRTKTNIFLQPGDRQVKPYQGYGSNDPLVRSGLLGPVRLEFGSQRDIGL